MKILHLATFIGNIGDNASHIGFKKVMSSIVGEHGFTIDTLEIRKAYGVYNLPDKWRFDEDFANKVNKYDLLVIGGGGLLDFDIANSSTGATIDISRDILDKIKTPILIGSIGANPRNLVPEGNIQKFRNFLDDFLTRKNAFLAVRNDGSKQAIKDQIGSEYADAIPELLDHGFFYQNDGNLYRPSPRRYILVNTTSDQVLMVNKNTGKIDADLYLKEITKVVNYIINETDYDVVFAPHIYSDLRAIDQILKNVNDYHIRTRVTICPYAQGDYGCDQIFSAYKNSDMVIGMRFHTNVCSMAMNVPSIGVAALERVVSVFASLGLSDCVIKADSEFSQSIIEKISYMPSKKPLEGHSKNLYDQKVDDTLANYKRVLNNWGLL
jgi:polysaccharide pyruvyl transferase WcaK-like protein